MSSSRAVERAPGSGSSPGAFVKRSSRYRLHEAAEIIHGLSDPDPRFRKHAVGELADYVRQRNDTVFLRDSKVTTLCDQFVRHIFLEQDSEVLKSSLEQVGNFPFQSREVRIAVAFHLTNPDSNIRNQVAQLLYRMEKAGVGSVPAIESFVGQIELPREMWKKKSLGFLAKRQRRVRVSPEVLLQKTRYASWLKSFEQLAIGKDEYQLLDPGKKINQEMLPSVVAFLGSAVSRNLSGVSLDQAIKFIELSDTGRIEKQLLWTAFSMRYGVIGDCPWTRVSTYEAAAKDVRQPDFITEQIQKNLFQILNSEPPENRGDYDCLFGCSTEILAFCERSTLWPSEVKEKVSSSLWELVHLSENSLTAMRAFRSLVQENSPTGTEIVKYLEYITDQFLDGQRNEAHVLELLQVILDNREKLLKGASPELIVGFCNSLIYLGDSVLTVLSNQDTPEELPEYTRRFQSKYMSFRNRIFSWEFQFSLLKRCIHVAHSFSGDTKRERVHRLGAIVYNIGNTGKFLEGISRHNIGFQPVVEQWMFRGRVEDDKASHKEEFQKAFQDVTFRLQLLRFITNIQEELHTS